MNEDFDINKVTAEFLSSNLDKITTIGKSVLTGASEEIQLRLKTAYKHYLETIGKRFIKTRTFFFRDEPVHLYDFYIPTGLSSFNANIEIATIKELNKVDNNLIITGTGGSGKTILLKHLLLDSLKEKKQIPVFIELRDYNSYNRTFEDFLINSILDFNLDVDKKFIRKAFKAEHFLFLLDGLDEVKTKKRDKIVKGIDQLTKKYKTHIILTSRPDENLSSLNHFTELHMSPLSLRKCISLIDKLPADEEIKNKFQLDLKNSLYQKHKSFLSNPLLLSIMLITYGYSADIPTKLSIFYNQAYEALFQRHDALKGAFQRKKETNLDIKDFAKIFSVFCILTYDKRKFEFSESDIIKYLETAKKITDLDFDTKKYLQDLVQSVCMLVQDGLLYTFSHRSFQEYFAAQFIINANDDTKRKLIKKYKAYISEDNVFSLLYEMDQEFIENEVILPFLEDFFKKIKLKKNIGITHFQRYVRLLYTRFYFKADEDDFYATIKDDYLNSMINFILLDLKHCYTTRYNKLNQSEYFNLLMKQSKETDIEFSTKDLTIKSEFLNELFNNAIHFSKTTLIILLEVQKYLIRKKDKSQDSITQILFKK